MSAGAAPSFPDDVDVAIVSFNARATLPRVLDSLAAAGVPASRLTIVDNASTDDTVTWLAAAWPAVRVTRLPDNRGPNPARNAAILAATRPLLLLLDADAYVRADVPARLRARIDPSGGIAAVAPVVVYAHDPSTIQYGGGSVHFICEAINAWRDRPLVERGDEPHDVGAAPGVTYLLDTAAARRAGLFDERYFAGKEDGDFCHRLRIAGYRLVEDPTAVVEHGAKPRSAWLFPFQIRNRWHFMLRNYELRTLLLMLPALAIHESMQFALLTIKGHLGAYPRAVRGLLPWLGTLGQDRRALAAVRRRHDRQLLSSAPLVVRADLVGGRAGRFVKRLYDAWLGGYWAVIKPFLS